MNLEIGYPPTVKTEEERARYRSEFFARARKRYRAFKSSFMTSEEGRAEGAWMEAEARAAEAELERHLKEGTRR